jgi:L-ascorbate metabolism protein UlaG (beta-lactamase superfamily)
MKITFFGHSCFLIELGGKTIILDPFISGNELAKDISVEELKVDYVLLSHGHLDHILDAEVIAKNNQAPIVSNFEIVSWFGEKGLTNGVAMNHGGTVALDFGSVKMVNAVHSSVLPDGSNGGNPAGFVIESENKKFYYAGDTALHMDMKLIGDYEKPDFSILPIGDTFTMGVKDAIIASDFVKTDKVIAMHFDTFPPIATNTNEAKSSFKKEGKELIVLSIGESVEL